MNLNGSSILQQATFDDQRVWDDVTYQNPIEMRENLHRTPRLITMGNKPAVAMGFSRPEARPEAMVDAN